MPGRNASIRTLLVALVAVLVVPLLGLVAYFGYQAARVEIREVENRMLAIADATALATYQFLYDAEQNLARIAEHPAVRSMDSARCAALASVLAELFLPGYTNVLVWSLEEGEICSTFPYPEGEGVEVEESPPWLPTAIAAGGFWVGPVEVGRRTGRWNTALTHPIRNPAGEKTGLVVVGLDLVHFQRILARMEPEAGGIITIAQEDMAVVSRSGGGEDWVGDTLTGTGIGPRRETQEGRGVSRARTLEGEDYLFGYVPVPNAPWRVYAGVPARTVWEPILGRSFRSALATLAILFLVFLVGAYVYRRITTPLESLLEEASGARPGDPAPLRPRGPREIALVAERFNEAWKAWGAAEEERARSDERIRSLVENAVTGIYVSTEGDRFLEVNQALVDLLGFDSREELLNTPVSALYGSQEERERHIREFGDRTLATGVQVAWRRKDGSPVTVRLFARRVPDPGGDRAWEVIVEDVTELIRLQEQYLQAQKMEALGRLAGGIAHDFNNLLTVVQGQADLILEDPLVGEDLKSQVGEIYEAAVRGGALNRQLLAFGRRSPVHRGRLDLNQILRGIEIMLRRAAGEEIRIQTLPSPELGWIRGDRSQMEQVLMNLVVNARDAMPRGGDLLIETYNASVSPEELIRFPQATPGPHVVLSVTDSGTGIDPEVLPHIFEPFFTTKPESQGTGLGLATVYGIVADSGGHIRVESAPDHGTTFRVFFPTLESEEAETSEEGGKAIPRTGSGVILLAEDEEAVRRLTKKILERAGYEVIQAADGLQALEVARNRDGPIHLLLTDVVMPGMRGPELAETLAAEGRIRRAVFFSGYADGMREAGPGGVEAWELIAKPFNAADLLGAIERVMKA